MSGLLTGRALYLKLAPHLKLTMICLTDASDDKGYSWPSKDRMRQQLNIKDIDGVRRNISELEKRGYLTRESRFDKDGMRTSNGYQLDLDKLPSPPAYKRTSAPHAGTPPAPQAGETSVERQYTTTTTTPRPREPGFIVETREYVKAQGGSPEDHTDWWDYNEMVGWRTTKGPLRDWKASARTWLRRKPQFNREKAHPERDGPPSQLDRIKSAFTKHKGGNDVRTTRRIT